MNKQDVFGQKFVCGSNWPDPIQILLQAWSLEWLSTAFVQGEAHGLHVDRFWIALLKSRGCLAARHNEGSLSSSSDPPSTYVANGPHSSNLYNSPPQTSEKTEQQKISISKDIAVTLTGVTFSEL